MAGSEIPCGHCGWTTPRSDFKAIEMDVLNRGSFLKRFPQCCPHLPNNIDFQRPAKSIEMEVVVGKKVIYGEERDEFGDLA